MPFSLQHLGPDCSSARVNLLYKSTGATEMSVYRQTHCLLHHVHTLPGEGKSHIYLTYPHAIRKIPRGEIREKQMTPCLFIKGDDISLAVSKRCVVAFTVVWVS